MANLLILWRNGHEHGAGATSIPIAVGDTTNLLNFDTNTPRRFLHRLNFPGSYTTATTIVAVDSNYPDSVEIDLRNGIAPQRCPVGI
jgi:hypothetical protein